MHGRINVSSRGKKFTIKNKVYEQLVELMLTMSYVPIFASFKKKGQLTNSIQMTRKRNKNFTHGNAPM